jgi:phospholipid/cholesterol/gamma-HCH transport system substrate-binding protein
MRAYQRQARNVRIAEIVMIVITIAGVAYLGDSVIQANLFASSRTVTVELPSGGGLFPGSTVTYRGERVGKVRDVALSGDGVRATVRLDAEPQIPADTEAVVANLSAIGEQYLDFRPRSDGGPYLVDGSVVRVKDTRVPLRFDRLLSDVADVADRIDTEDVQTITREVGAVFATDADLTTIGRRSDSALRMLEELQPTLRHLMINAKVPLQTIDDKGDELRTFASDIDLLTAELESADGTARGLINDLLTTIPLVDDLLADVEPHLEPVLADSLTIAGIAADRRPGLDHWLTWAPDQMVGMAESTRDGKGRVLLVPNPSKTCQYGTPNRSPLDTTRTPAVIDAHCTLVEPRVQQRGAQYAPRP